MLYLLFNYKVTNLERQFYRVSKDACISVKFMGNPSRDKASHLPEAGELLQLLQL